MVSKKRAEFEANATLAEARQRQHGDAIKAAKYKRRNVLFRRTSAVVLGGSLLVIQVIKGFNGNWDVVWVVWILWMSYAIWRGRPDN